MSLVTRLCFARILGNCRFGQQRSQGYITEILGNELIQLKRFGLALTLVAQLVPQSCNVFHAKQALSKRYLRSGEMEGDHHNQAEIKSLPG
jgi:hypothetical protein